MTTLERLNSLNDVPVFSVRDEAFRPFGRVLEGWDFSELISYMENCTPIPENGNIYVPSVPEMEEMSAAKALQAAVYGGMPIETGYCNGRNTTYNGFEYHKGSEINIAVTDFMLVLGHSYDILESQSYDISSARVFFVEKGMAIEMYQTTLHLSPLRVTDAGFRDIVVLPRGTNTPLSGAEKAARDAALKAGDGEARLLLQKNKWVIAHPQRKPLIDQGAWPGVTGENKELKY